MLENPFRAPLGDTPFVATPALAQLPEDLYAQLRSLVERLTESTELLEDIVADAEREDHFDVDRLDEIRVAVTDNHRCLQATV